MTDLPQTTPPRAPVFRCAECEAVWRTQAQRDRCCTAKPETVPQPTATDRDALRLVLLMAPSFQGGHSKTGAEVAAFLGIESPLRMPALGAVARKLGFNPAQLWPWSTTA